jgi:hypothetical protein
MGIKMLSEGPFLIGFKLYSLKGLLWDWKFKLFPKSASNRSSSQEISKG